MFLLQKGYIFLSCDLYYIVVGSPTLSSKLPQKAMIRIQLTIDWHIERNSTNLDLSLEPISLWYYQSNLEKEGYSRCLSFNLKFKKGPFLSANLEFSDRSCRTVAAEIHPASTNPSVLALGGVEVFWGEREGDAAAEEPSFDTGRSRRGEMRSRHKMAPGTSLSGKPTKPFASRPAARTGVTNLFFPSSYQK